NNPSWNLITAQADDCIEYMKRITAINEDQPFFVYYVPGAVHAPHHPTEEWIKKIHDMHLFDKGWNELRNTIFANQQKLRLLVASPGLYRDGGPRSRCSKSARRSRRTAGDSGRRALRG